jgi:NADH-quinone oxidoreductase subunit I
MEQSPYFENITKAVKTSWIGLKLTFQHLVKAIQKPKYPPLAPENINYFAQNEGIVTLKYPFEKIPLPDHSRYKLHNEIEDCIVCDKCAKICPVNCIDIEVIKSTEQIGNASDGTPIRLYASKFDIDMAKCCYCGLCTTVCPTECLTMTKEYDDSVFDLEMMNLKFSNMTEDEIIAKKTLYEQQQIAKNTQKNTEEVLKNSNPET